MNKNKLNTLLNFLGVVVIGISIPISIYLLKTGSLDLRITAFLSDEPVNVVISDVKADSFKVSWITEKQVYGAVKLLDTDQPLTDTLDTNFHSLILTKLQNGKNYQFQLLSGNTVFEKIYTVQTHAVNRPQTNNWIFGQVFNKDGVSAQQGGILTLELSKNSLISQSLAAVINETGGYQFNFGGITDLEGQSFPYQQSVDLQLTIYPDHVSNPVIRKFTMNLNYEKQIPNIYLGDINLQVIPGVPGN